MFETIRGHTIFAPSLGQDSVILDLGANHGDFSKQMKDRHGGTYYLAEANPILAKMLADENFSRVWHCAVAGQDGQIDFNVSPNDEASSILNSTETSSCQCIKVPSRSINSLLSEMPSSGVDLIKMDIEGAEGQALRGIPEQRLRKIGQITVEFHSDERFGLDIGTEVREAIRYLKRNDFLFLNFSGTTLMNVLFINRTRNKIPFLQGKLWEWAGARPRWLRNLKEYVPPVVRHAINEILDRLAGRKNRP